MSIWALADLHLSFGNPEKSMELFGWGNYAEKIKKNWISLVKEEDLVILAGDLSWSCEPEKVRLDLDWIDKLPGTKLIIKGNHDRWWGKSAARARALLPPSIHLIYRDAFFWKGVAFAGARLWDSSQYDFKEAIEYKENPNASKIEEMKDDEKIFERELEALDYSLYQMDKTAVYRIAITHYPPIGSDLKESKASAIFEKHGVNTVVFGHLHSVKPDKLPFGNARGINYLLTSCDVLNFSPILILKTEDLATS